MKDKCLAKIEMLKELGHQLRRPTAEYLGDGIYELRIKSGGMNYRILYFFHNRSAIILTQGFLKKQAKVPKKEIRLAAERKKKYETNPERHTR